jgi:hypothetical protein
MATTNELVDLVSDIIQDSSYSDATILSYLNRGLRAIAGGVIVYYPDGSKALSSPLPNLATTSDITTTTAAYVALPSDYSRELYAAVNSGTGVMLFIEDAFLAFLRKYPKLDRSSSVHEVSINGTSLYYQGIPSTAETITLYYHEAPTALTAGTGTPSCLPVHLQEDLLANYVAWKIYDQIEDGVEGQKINTMNYKTLFNEAMINLQEEITVLQGSVQFVPEEW